MCLPPLDTESYKNFLSVWLASIASLEAETQKFIMNSALSSNDALPLKNSVLPDTSAAFWKVTGDTLVFPAVVELFQSISTPFVSPFRPR